MDRIAIATIGAVLRLKNAFSVAVTVGRRTEAISLGARVCEGRMVVVLLEAKTLMCGVRCRDNENR